MTKKFEKGLVHVIREQLLQGNTLTIDGIGTFEVEHQKQMAVRQESGKTILMPPRDVVKFTREESAS